MKNTWYWSIVKIPLKVYRQPAIIFMNLEQDVTMVTTTLPKALCCWRMTIED